MALMFWFGATAYPVWAWRKAFGVGGHATTKGSKRAIRVAALKGEKTVKAEERADEELDVRAETAKACGTLRGPHWTPDNGGWTAAELALLGIDHGEALAKTLGRTQSAVTNKRVLSKIPAFSGWPGGGPGWTAEELARLGTDTDEAVAERIGRTPGAVAQKRAVMKIAKFRGQYSS